ncbi:MAG: response regulator [Aphanocapsa sp. GSE-SYN-MK-11-07L]|jgi:chemotaxis family two-component system sensor histidine kinase/response regulator PixL|nr:response regulator [Aphanocapsa sp. GSE-SYN-MK-11-07L]
MAIHPDIRDQAYRFFVQEAPEFLQMIEAELLGLRQDRSTAKVHTLMRAAHSIKGGSANVGLAEIKILAHRLEDCFRSLYNEELAIDDQLEQLLLQAYDCLRLPLLEAIRVGSTFDGEAALMAAEPVFAQIEHHLGDYLATEDRLPTVAEMGIDIALQIFTTDVAAALNRMAAVQPDQPTLTVELRSQAEVFQGLAELLDLPGLGEIAQLTLTALERSPQQAPVIMQVALADFQASYQAVIDGDRKQGGTPAAALRQLAEAESYSINLECDFKLENFHSSFSDPDLEDIDGMFSNITQPREAEPLSSLWSEIPAEASSSPELAVASLWEEWADQADQTDPTLVEPALSEPSTEPPSIEDIFNQIGELTTLADQANQEADSPAIPADLATALSAIEQDFDQLPSFEESLPPIAAQPPAPILTAQAPQPTDRKPAEQLTVRLEMAQLERMNNQIGELAINRNSLSLQNEQLQASLQNLRQRFEQFLGIGGQLRTQLNKMLISPDRYTGARLQSTSMAITAPGAAYRSDFDSLELDRYGEIYNLLQSAVESILLLEEKVGDVTLFAEQSDRGLVKQQQLLTGLRNELMWARMLPLENILNRFPRLLREMSLQYKKPVDLQLSGTGVLVDKALLEKLYDPLLHLLRNAFDHGVESAQLRQQQGKPERGQIKIHAYYQGSRTMIEVTDDGGGIDLEKIRTKAVEMGYLPAQEAGQVSSDRLLDFMFEPGFSTADQVSELSGRGVGLDIVRAQLQSLKGTVSLTSHPGKGTTFTLRIPLTLGISKLLVVWSGVSSVALPSDSIEDLVNPQPQQIKRSSGQRFLQWGDRLIPIYSLQNLLPYNCPLPETAPNLSLGSVPTPAEWASPLLVLRQGGQPFALEVEKLLVEQELVIKPLSSALKAPSYLYGCTIMGDGTLVPVIDTLSLIAGLQGQPPQVNQPTQVPKRLHTLPSLLIVDDSAGMRQTLSMTLERAGYRVLQARDGREALEQLQQHPVKLVICDVEMPVMNGFEFLTHRRQDPDLMSVPVVMLTSRGGEKHKRLALQLGATDYFTKPYIEQQFLLSLQGLLQDTAIAR